MRDLLFLIVHKDHPLHIHGVNSGAEMASLYLARYLARAGYKVALAAQLVEGEQEIDGVMYWDLGPDYQTRKVIERAHALGNYVVIACGRAQALMDSRHDCRCLGRFISSQDRSSSDTGLTARTLAKVANGIICASKAQTEFFIKDGADPSLLHVVHNGADLSVFKATDPKLRDPYNLVFAGALVPDKGIHWLINSFALLKPKYPKLTLDVYGSAALWGREPMFDEKQIQASIPGVVFHGAQPRAVIAQAYGRAGIGVVPSIWFDPFPLTSIEAQVTGCPVLTFNIGGLGEGVRNNVTGVVIEEISPEALTANLDQLLANPTRLMQMSEQCIALQRPDYSWEKAAAKYAEIAHKHFRQTAAGGADSKIGLKTILPTSQNVSATNEGSCSKAIRITVSTLSVDIERSLKRLLPSLGNSISDSVEILIIRKQEIPEHSGPKQALLSGHVSELFLSSEEVNGLRTEEALELRARNKAICNMSGDYLLWLGEEDLLTENTLPLYLEAINKNQLLTCYYGNTALCNESGQVTEQLVYPTVSKEKLLSTLLFEETIQGRGSLVAKSIYTRAGLYDESFPLCADREFYARALLNGASFIHLNETTCLTGYTHLGAESNNQTNFKDPDKSSAARKKDELSRILLSVLEQADLRTIFPDCPWDKEPQIAACQALTTAAYLFLLYGNKEAALECSEKAGEYDDSLPSRIIRACSLRANGKFEAATQFFAQCLFSSVRDLSSLGLDETYLGAEIWPNRQRLQNFLGCDVLQARDEK